MNDSNKFQTFQTVTAAVSITCVLIALTFFVTAVFFLRNSSRPGESLTQSGLSNAEVKSSVFADPKAVETRLHTELGRYLDEMGDDRFNLSIAIETDDGSVSYFFNCDKEQEAASLYKLPLAMLYCDQIEEGTIDEEELISFNASALRTEGWNPIAALYAPGSQVPLDEAIESMLTHSDNVAAAILYENLGGWEEFAAEQMTYSKQAAQPGDSLDNVVNANQVMDELRILQKNPQRYKRIAKALDEAADDAYLNEWIEPGSMLQKYGQIDANTNAAGYSKSGVPYRIVVLSESAQCQLDPGQVNEIAWNIFNSAKKNEAAVQPASSSSAPSSLLVTSAASS